MLSTIYTIYSCNVINVLPRIKLSIIQGERQQYYIFITLNIIILLRYTCCSTYYTCNILRNDTSIQYGLLYTTGILFC